MASWNSLAIISRFSRTMAAPRGARLRWLYPAALHAARRLRGQPPLTSAPRMAAEPGGGRLWLWVGMMDFVFSLSCDVGRSCSPVPLPGLGGYRVLGAGVLPRHRKLLQGGTLLPLPCPGSSSSSFS